jgi:hypothetical protein
MMGYTEHDLRAALAERVQGGPPDVREIVRRGRALRRRRAAAGVTLAAALATAVVLLVPRLVGIGSVDKVTPMAATVTPRPHPTPVASGPDRSRPLIKEHRSDRLGVATTITFQRLSHYTTFWVICADPKAFVVVDQRGGRKGRSGMSAGPCGGRGFAISGGSPASGRLERPGSVKVWVLPPDPPAVRSGRADNEYRCKALRKDLGLCDGMYLSPELTRPGVVERLAALIGPERGRWKIQIHDQVGATVPWIPGPDEPVTLD